jgi:cell division protease FtsH
MKKALFFSVIILAVALGGWIVLLRHADRDTISYTQFLQQVQTGQVTNIKIESTDRGASRAAVLLKGGATTYTILPPDYSAALKVLEKNSVNIEIQDSSADPARMLLNATPFLLLLAFWIVLMFNRRSFLRWRG